jgi:hypothetical protein
MMTGKDVSASPTVGGEPSNNFSCIPMTCSMICVIGCIEEDFNDGYAYVANSYSRTVDSPIVRGSVCCLFCGRDHIIGLRMSSRPER